MAHETDEGTGQHESVARRTRGATRPAPKGGRDAVVTRVLDAAEVLFSEHPYADVSVRAIADAAGVSHALVHRYVGTKADILRAVLVRHEGDLAQVAADATTAREAAVLMLSGDMRSTERYFRLVLRVAMDSVLREVSGISFPATRLLARLAAGQQPAARGTVDPRLAVAAVVSMVVGFAGLRRDLLPEVGLEDVTDADLDRQMAALVGALLGIAEPDADAGA